MLLDQIRVFQKIEAAALTDVSMKNQDDSKTVVCNLGTASYLYVAQRFPFAHLFFESAVANDVASNLSVEFWDGTEWVAAVDVMDGTQGDAAKSFSQSGQIIWNIPDNKSWQLVGSTQDTTAPAALSTLSVYNMYWMRFSVSVALKATTAFKEISYALTQTQELKNIDSDIDNFMASIGGESKTDWIREIRTASKMVVTQLKAMGLVMAPGQIIELDDVYLPTTYKTLSLIYFHLGEAYAEKRKEMEKSFKIALNIRRFTFDLNNTGKIEAPEIANKVITRVR